MAGRPCKPRPSDNKERALASLRATLATYHAAAEREAAERILGRPIARRIAGGAD